MAAASPETMDDLLGRANNFTSTFAFEESFSPFWAVALESFAPESEDEMKLTRGETMLILGTDGEGQGWLQACRGAERGFVPETWVMRQELRPAISSVRSPLVAHNAGGGPEKAGATVAQVEEGELLGIVEANGGHSLVIKGAHMSAPIGPGWVPSTSMKLAVAALVVQSFTKEEEIEVSLSVGQRVWMLQRLEPEDPDWCDVMTFMGE